MDIKNSIVSWLFFSVILPLSPFLFATLLVLNSPSYSNELGLPTNWSKIFTSAELLFLGMVVCASGIRDSRELETYERSNLPTLIIFYLLILGAFAAAILYADILSSRLRKLERPENLWLSTS